MNFITWNPMGIVWIFSIFALVTPVLLTILISEGKCSVYNTFLHYSNFFKNLFLRHTPLHLHVGDGEDRGDLKFSGKHPIRNIWRALGGHYVVAKYPSSFRPAFFIRQELCVQHYFSRQLTVQFIVILYCVTASAQYLTNVTFAAIFVKLCIRCTRNKF